MDIVDYSNQELVRIIEELEAMSEPLPVGMWIPTDAAASWLCIALGYADANELEDAIKCTMAEFVQKVPHLEYRTEPQSSFRSRLTPVGIGQPSTHVIRVNSRADLFRVIVKPSDATLEIPPAGLTIPETRKRHIDILYNYIGNTIFDLGQLLIREKDKLDDPRNLGIMDCVNTLNLLLDVEKPFEVILTDPTGTASFFPADGIESTPLPVSDVSHEVSTADNDNDEGDNGNTMDTSQSSLDS